MGIGGAGAEPDTLRVRREGRLLAVGGWLGATGVMDLCVVESCAGADAAVGMLEQVRWAPSFLLTSTLGLSTGR